MTVSTTTSRIPYVGDGVSTVFPVPFLFLANADISVFVDGVEVMTGFTTTGAGEGTGDVTFSVAPANLAAIVLVRIPDTLQNTALPLNGPFPSTSVERMSDKAMIGLQRVEDLVSRSLTLQDGDAAADMTLPLAEERASQLLGFDAAGLPIAYPGASGDVTSASNVTFVQEGTGAAGRTVQDKLREYISVTDFMTAEQQADVMAGTAAVDVGAAVQAAILEAESRGYGLLVPGLCRIENIELVVRSSISIFGYHPGVGYAGSSAGISATYTQHCGFLFVGTGTQRIRTRRLFRAAGSDPQDSAMSVGLNIEAENVRLHRLSVALYCDYTDGAINNLGSNYDCGIFVGCRVGYQEEDVHVLGYWRVAGRYFDVTRATTLPEFSDPNGLAFGAGTVKNGADGCKMMRPMSHGGRKAIFVAGAKPKVGQTTYTDPYYDQALGTTVADARGTFGFSDFEVHGGWLYGADHHSLARRADPLNPLSYSTEDLDTLPSVVTIDGLAGNASGKLQGMRFYGTRFSTWEAAKIALGRVNRVYVMFPQFDAAVNPVFKADGVTSIDPTDTSTTSYGAIGATSISTLLTLQGSNSKPHSGHCQPGTKRFIALDSTDNDSTSLPTISIQATGQIVAESGDLDLRSATTGDLIRLRVGTTSIAEVTNTGWQFSSSLTNPQVVAQTGDLDLRAAAAGTVRLRNGGTTALALTGTSAVFTVTSAIRPTADNSVTAGAASQRYSVVYAGTGAINTSDAREKQDVRTVTDSETAVARRLKGLLRAFRFKNAAASKGDQARVHFGVVAQDVEEAFRAEGLDPFAYALLCFDEWEAVPEVLDVDGNVLEAYQPAGNRYGVRYDELLAFVLAAM